MKRYVLIVFSCVMMFLFLTAVCNAKGPYISGNVGVAIADSMDASTPLIPGIVATAECDTGIAFGLAFGYDFDGLRVEAEGAYQKNDFDTVSALGITTNLAGDVDVFSLLCNVYYDFNNSSPITPYIGAGIGMSMVSINDIGLPNMIGPVGLSLDDTALSYQVGGGVSFIITKRVSLDLKYRYLCVPDLQFLVADSDFDSHNILLGLRFSI